MPDNFLLYLMLVAALAIGFLLGRRDWRRRRSGESTPRNSYLKSLGDLQGSGYDPALDAVLEAVAASGDSVDMRLALGTLIRRRGEVDKAIRIHQGLLARPMLTATQRAQTEMELGRDYFAAGLLGRAENLFADLASRNSPERDQARQGLLEIYQREREWRQAVVVGEKMARQDKSIRPKLAHFQCELAEKALAEGDPRRARQELARGADFDPGCARVNLLRAEVELAAERPKEARKHLRRAIAQDPDCIPQAVSLHRQASEALAEPAGHVSFLEACLEQGAYLPAVEELAAHVESRDGAGAAAEFVLAQLLRNPSLGGFVTLLEHLDREGKPMSPEHLALVQRFSQSLLERQPVYRCRNCGFSSRSLMWQCPSCHEWGSAKPIVRLG